MKYNTIAAWTVHDGLPLQPEGSLNTFGVSMSEFDGISFSLEEFSGTARLFPLPNLVMFPQVIQPLHIFEPRYRKLLEDTLADDGLFATATLAPGWEANYEGRPPVAPVACLGKVAAHFRLEGGEYNVLLVGLRRLRILEEFPPTKPYREARVELCDDLGSPAAADADPTMLQRLREGFLQVLSELPQAQDQVEQLMAGGVSLSTLTDVMSFMMEIEVEKKVALLSELDAYRRAEMLLKHLSAAVSSPLINPAGVPVFPPQFSLN